MKLCAGTKNAAVLEQALAALTNLAEDANNRMEISGLCFCV